MHLHKNTEQRVNVSHVYKDKVIFIFTHASGQSCGDLEWAAYKARTYSCIYTCLHRNIYTHPHILAQIYPNTHSSKYKYMHTDNHAYMHRSTQTCIHATIHTALVYIFIALC